jgi:hypothetical protein
LAENVVEHCFFVDFVVELSELGEGGTCRSRSRHPLHINDVYFSTVVYVEQSKVITAERLYFVQEGVLEDIEILSDSLASDLPDCIGSVRKRVGCLECKLGDVVVVIQECFCV